MQKLRKKSVSSQSNEITKASIKNGAILALFALISTGLIALVHLMTKEKISEEIEAAMARRLNEIVDKDQYDNDVYHDCTLISGVDAIGPPKSTRVFRMRLKDENYGVFFTSIAPDGYAGKIKMVLGIYEDGTIAGVRVTEHQETPGLGDKIEIEKSDWIKQFDGKSLANLKTENWKVKKDGGTFDALTGATITPRAIVKAVHQAAVFYSKNKQTLYQSNQSCGEKS